jgi:DNA-binding beta-propeller fold protein YncE
MGIARGTRRGRIVIGLAAAASAGLMAVTSAGAAAGAPRTRVPSMSSSPSTSLAAYSASFGFTGHAGLYAYGMGFDYTDNTILVGDLWNYVVRRFTESGTKDGVVSKIAPRGAMGGIGAPFGVTSDSLGDVWVADQSNSRIVEFSHTGTWIQTIGSGGGPNPGENYPVGCGNGSTTIPTHLTVDPGNGDVYVSDPRCHAVYVYNNVGVYQRSFTWNIKGTPIPRGIAMDAQGNLYVAEFNTRKIYLFNKAGQQLGVFQGAPDGTDMADVRGIAVDNLNGRIYAVGAEFNKVVVFSFQGTYLATWSSAGATNFSSIRFVTADQVGDVYVSDIYGYIVWKFDKNGKLLAWATPAAPPPNGGWNQVNGIAVDPSTGYLYAVDTFGNRVQVFNTSAGMSCPSKTSCAAFVEAFGQRGPLTPNSPNLDYPHVVAIGTQHDLWMDGTNSLIHWDISTIPPTFLGTQGVHGRELAAFKNGPQGLQVAPFGTNSSAIYTVDTGNCRVQIFDYSGNLLAHMGGCGSGADLMSAPRQLTVDALHHHVYVADTGHNRVVEYDTSTGHIIATFTSAGGVHLSQPRGVTIDPTGTWVYVGDSNNNRVVRVHADLSAASAVVVTTGSDTPEGSFGGPEWLAFGPDGRLFVSDNNQVVYAFTIIG